MDFGHCHSSTAGPAVAEVHRPLCRCLNVTESDVLEAISEHQPQTVQGVSQICGAGAGCMSCHRHIRRMLSERVLDRQSDPVAN
jgi:bacterioferritin-associated ferredoxin